MAEKKLTDKQRAFVDEYLIDLNATRAYKVVYKNVKSDDVARAAAARMLANVSVKEYLNSRMNDRQKRVEITQDDVLRDLADLFNTKVTDIVNIVEEPVIINNAYVVDPDTGKVKTYKHLDIKATDKLSESAQKAITSIKQGKYGIEVGIVDKTRIIELIGRHLGMFNDKLQINNEADKQKTQKLDAIANLLAQMKPPGAGD